MEIKKIYQGNTLDVLKNFPDCSIDMCITSPPYWALRKYGTEHQYWDGDKNCEHNFEEISVKQKGQINIRKRISLENNLTNKTTQENHTYSTLISQSCQKCGCWKGELGSEPDFDLYLTHLLSIFDELKRVLKKEGSFYLNIGDTYSGSHCMGFTNQEQLGIQKRVYNNWQLNNRPSSKTRLINKSLVGIPFRIAIMMIESGWCLRNTIIWHKESICPSSVTDRFTNDFEYLFFFTKSKNYYFEKQFEPFSKSFLNKSNYVYTGNKNDEPRELMGYLDGNKSHLLDNQGRNKRCVWTINPIPSKLNHYAGFPFTLVETPIKASCPEFICLNCGKAKQTIYKKEYIDDGGKAKYGKAQNEENIDEIFSSAKMRLGRVSSLNTKIGMTDCNCNAGFRSGIVLDIFMGTGSTAVACEKLNRSWIGIELKQEYIDMATERIRQERIINTVDEESKPEFRKLFTESKKIKPLAEFFA